MTELGRARDRLEHQKTELQRSNEELQQFAYVASHDLQEPLRAVSGCAQILSRTYRGNLDANADQLLTHIVEGAERMRTLIQDLLALSRVTTHARELVRVDCEAACAAALVNLSASIADGGASVDVSTLPMLTGDYGQLVQLFQNLIGNALKYRSSRRPQIQVGCNTSSVEHIFFVRDNGIGIEARYFDRIFSLFQRLHTRSEYAGTGIGLAICKKVVQHHNGRIWLESTPDEGSTFYFSIPCEPRRLGL
jgi:light-regulated signal transduction histidine kinase (bacteriophytochrome)